MNELEICRAYDGLKCLRLKWISNVFKAFLSLSLNFLLLLITITQKYASKNAGYSLAYITHLIRYFDPTESVNSRDGLLSLDKFHYLDVPQIDVLMVYDDLECIFNCVDHPLCMSVNLAAEEKLWCELLSSDKENSTKKYYQNESSHHYYFPVRKYRQN